MLRQHDRLRDDLSTSRDLAAGQRVANSAHRLELAMRGLHAVSPLATLDRGYAIVEDAESGKVLMKAGDATVGGDIRARLATGELTATVKSKKGTS